MPLAVISAAIARAIRRRRAATALRSADTAFEATARALVAATHQRDGAFQSVAERERQLLAQHALDAISRGGAELDAGNLRALLALGASGALTARQR